MTLVVDASVAFKWFKDEPGTVEAMALITGPSRLIAPDLVIAEVCNAAWRSRRGGSMTEQQYQGVPRGLSDAFAVLYPMRSLAPRALELASVLDHPLYDCMYLALAERESTVVVTADRRLTKLVAGSSWGALVRELA